MRPILLGACAALLALTGCVLEEDAGGGGGLGDFLLDEGFVFIPADGRDVHGVNLSDTSSVAPLTANGQNAYPSLSQDGKRVVFVHGEGSASELQTVASSGGTPTPVLAADATKTRFRHPVFSPDGTRIVFTYDSGASAFLGIVNTDGSDFRELAGGSSLSYASGTFYPDGLHVLAAVGSSASSLTQLEKVNLATGQPENVLSTLGNETQFIANRVVISPDGTQAAFDGPLSTGATRIFVVDLSTKQVRQLTENPGEPNANDRFPSWQGTSKIAFDSNAGGNDNVYALPASSTKTSGGFLLGSATQPWFGEQR